MVDLTTQTGILKGMLAGLGTAGGLFVFEKLAGWITDAVQGFSNLSSAMKMLNAGSLGADEFQKLLTLTDGLSKSQTKLILSYTSLSDAQKISILMSQGMTQAEAQASLSAMGLTTAQMSATGATVSLTGALQGLWATLMVNPLILVAAGVTAAVTAFNAYKKSVEESVTSAREAGSSWQESSDSLQSQISRVTELKTALDSGTMTEEEAYQAKSELLSIQESLTDSYGKQAEGIDLVNGSLEEQINLLSQIDKDSANKFLNENKTGIDKATSEMEKGRHYYLGRVSASTEEGKGLQDIINKYTDKGLTATKNGDGTFTIAFDGDVSQAEQTLNDFETEVRQMQKTFTDSNILEDVSQNVSDSLGKNNEILDEYQDLYKQALNASLVADSSLYGSGKEQKTAVTWLNEYSKAIEEYNNALAEGDTSKIAEASEQFTTLDEKIHTLTSATGMSEYASQFEEVRNQLNQTAVAQKAFMDILDGQSTSSFDKEIKKYTDDLKELSMTDIDFKDAFETDGIQKGEDAVNSLTNAAVEMGLITGKSSEEVQTLIDFLVQAGVLASDTAGKVSDTSRQIATDIATIVADEASAFNQAKKDMESANKGDTYDSMYEMAKKAKELLKSGDVGTDDFKSIAKMFSPSGADDYKNFEENLGKINRYFTEDNSGVKNFLKDLEKANVEYYTTIQKNAVQMMDNIASEYERVQARISQASTEIENAMNLNEAKGYRTSENYYKGMMDAEQKNIESMQEERTRLNNKLKSKLNSGEITYGTDDYWDQVDKINDVTNSIAESRTKIQEWQNDINELDWSNFERLQGLNSDITEEIEFLIDELSRVDLTDKDTGAFTDEGKAAMSLYASSYNVNKEQINQYQKELDEWYEKLKEDPFNENIIDHIQELEESQRDYVSALQDTKYAMIDLAKQGFEAQKDYLQDTIDKYKDLMDTQEDAYDYQKTINDAVKEINDIQKQIDVLSGDTSEENRARLQQLNVQLKDKQTSLEDTQRQKLTSDINDMFDDLMDNYSDYVNDLTNALDEDENFAKLIDAVNVGLDDTQTIIAKLAESFGIDLSDELSSILNGNNIGESTQKVTSGIEKEQQDIISKSNSNASNEVNSINTTNESEEADRKASYDSGVANRTNNAIEQAQQQASQSVEAQRLAEEQARQAADEKAKKDRADYLTALDYIGSHFYKPKSGTKASDIKNATKKKIFEKTGDRTVTAENLNALAGLLGVSSSGLYNRLNELDVFKSIGKKGLITTISQFAKGSKNITKPTLAMINEEGQEITYDKSQGAILTSLNPGDKVYTAKQAQILYDLSKGDYSSMIPYMHTSTPQIISSTSGDVSVAIGDINLQGVQTPRELAYAIKDVVKNDRTVRGLLKDVTVNELMPNHNSLSMNKW